MKIRRTQSSSYSDTQTHLLRLSLFISLALLFIVPLLTVSSASLSSRSSADSNLATKANGTSNPSRGQRLNQPDNGLKLGFGLIPKPSSPFTILPQAGPVENISVFQSDCFTPSQNFELGDTVCAKIQGAPIGGTRVRRRLVVTNPAGYIVAEVDVTTDPQDFTFTIPSGATSTFGDVVVDNRGAWNFHSVATFDGSIRASAWFSVSDPAEAVSDLAVTKFVTGPSEAPAGSSITFTVLVTNYGPNPASAVSLTDDVPANATFVDQFQDSGPVFTCVNPTAGGTGTSTCTTASLAKDDVAALRFVYQIDNGVAEGTEIKNTAAVSSTTEERNTADNSSSASVIVSTTPPAEQCLLTCRTDMVVTADTTQGGNPGAFVTFTPTDIINGNCGAVTASPASGSFFPVGMNTVNVSSELNSGSCSFTIKVLGTPAPTITCPSDKTATAGPGETTATVDPGTPSTTPSSGVTVTGERSDEQLLNAPYPIGVTGITWTVKDADGRTAGCEQRITVHANDRQAVTISCPSNKTFAAEGCAGRTLTTSEIGTPTTNPSDSHVTVEGIRSDGLSLSDPFPVGTTQITWTATDDTNDTSASCLQSITITGGSDSTPPVVDAPDDINATTASCSLFIDDLGPVTATDDCTPSESLVITRSGIPPGNVFPTGTTVITYSAKDANGNVGTATQNVTVLESPAVPPTVSAPGDVSRNTGPGATSCGVVVTDAELGTATANDNCPGVQVVRTGVPAGNLFPVGTTTITYTATDRSGNTAQDTQDVIVTDNTIPVVTPPAAVTLYTGPGATLCGFIVSNLDTTLGTGSATDNCPGVGPVTRSGVPAGNQFPVGTTTVTYSATDAHGNTDSATQTVTVIDNTVPVISCQTNITIEPSCPTGAIATYATPSAADNCGVQSINLTAGPASGSVFPIGTTTVTHVATDIHGNTATCSFTVTVLTPQAVIQNLQAAVNASSLTGTQKNGLLAKLSAALQGLNNGQTNVACNKMAEFNNSVQVLINSGSLSAATGNAWISSSNHVRNTIGCTSLPCS
jgi:uncharacterized repeat protein (TIGR01451 family)